MSKYLPDGNYAVIPDLQCPYHDKRTVQALTRFLWDASFDGLLCVGDESDSPEPSRWNKGMAAEYLPTFEKGLQSTYDTLLNFSQTLKKDKPFHLMRSNHADRIQKYLARYAPALSKTSWNQYERIMGYNGHTPLLENRLAPLPITFHHKPYQFAREWVMVHGDESGMSQSPGGTALGLAKKIGLSVVCGHTHRAGVQHFNSGHSGKLHTQLTGLEVGHAMDLKQAGYLGTGAANWQQAFAILRIRKGVVYPELILIKDHKFVVEGTHYGA